MKCLVDAGPIVRVLGVSPRDCVLSALVDLNGRARFPIDVMVVGTGDVYRFVENQREELQNGRNSLPQKTIKPAAR